MSEPLVPPGRGGIAVLPRVLARVALGLFIVWQLLFLTLGNLADAEPGLFALVQKSRKENGWLWQVLTSTAGGARTFGEWLDAPREEQSALGRLFRRGRKVADSWANWTGQEQGWGLFSPGVADYCCFPAVELRWHDHDERPIGPDVVLRSDNEPADVHRFLRFGGSRLRACEDALGVPLRNTDQPEEELLGRWAARIEDSVRARPDRYLAYLRWRLTRYLREHPGEPEPRQVVLRIRTWGIPAPPGPTPWTWTLESDVPVARWRPWLWMHRDHLPVEAYDPVARRFNVLERH